MAGLKFEGDVSEISDRQLKYIENVIIKRGQIKKVTIEQLGKGGANFIANVRRIVVEDEDGRILKMVAKMAPQVEAKRIMINVERLFSNEHWMYTEILPKLTQLEIAADIPPEERLKYATCFGSSNDAPHEVILLEDLSESNFTILDKSRPPSDGCIKSVLKDLAIFHSLSYVLKQKEPKLFEEYKNNLNDTWVYLNTLDGMKNFSIKVEANAVEIVDSDDHKKLLKGAVARSFDDIIKIAKSDRNSKQAVILHGDAWANNIMYKFDEDTLVRSIMIDYQASKVLNPAADLLYMLFGCTDYESRKEHFYSWIDYYHTELDKSLSNHGLKANFIYPKDLLDADLKRYGKMVFGISVLLYGIIIASTGEEFAANKVVKVDDAEFKEDNVKSEADPFKIKLEGLVNSFRELGLM